MKKRKKARWVIAYMFSHIFVKYILRNRLAYRDGIKVDVTKPFILLGNHSCFCDFLFAVNAIGPYPIKFVVAAKYFSNPILRKVLKFYGAVPKKLAEKDMECMRSIFSALKNGQNIGIYPEGRVSMWGTTEYISPSTAKLIKRFGCNLVLVQNLGSFFVRPPYGGTRKIGKTYSKVHVINSEEIADMTSSSLDEAIKEVISVDQYDWYNNKKRRYIGVERTKPLVNLIYRCPHCNKISSVEKRLKKLVCNECGLEGVIKNCHIKWNKPKIPNSISEIYTKLKDFEKKCIEEGNWSFESDCTIDVLHLDSGDEKRILGCRVSINLEEINLILKEEVLKISNKVVEYLPFDVGRDFQIYRGGKLYVIKPENKSFSAAFSVMHEAVKEYNESLREKGVNQEFQGV